ncbi:MAG: gamma-glutamyl-gamma-aminobutyrate hydrolase family protein [Candidatus Dormibacteria bacterium]
MTAPTLPLVLLPARSAVRDDPDGAEGLPIQMMNQAYLSALQRAGLTPLVVPLGTAFPCDLDWVDGLVLPGGADVDPASYGAVADPTSECDQPLDELEFRLFEWATANRIPVLGICRGLQVINVAMGGTLWQDLPTQRAAGVGHPRQGPRDLLTHRLLVDPGSRIHRILGADELSVNSLHHQGIDQLGRGLRASARAEDGLIEGIESTAGPFMVGVQFHPEELADTHPFARHLFEAFAGACCQHAADRSTALVGAITL